MTFGEICIHQQLKRKCYTCELEDTIEDLELRYQAARNVAILMYAKQITVKSSGGTVEGDYVDSEITKELQRLKSEKKDTPKMEEKVSYEDTLKELQKQYNYADMMKDQINYSD